MGGLIVLTPEAVMKLDGAPMRSVFKSIDKESLFKGLERAKALKLAKFPKSLGAQLVELLDPAPPSRFKSLFGRAVAGDADAVAEVGAMGDWEVFCSTAEPTTPLRAKIPCDMFAEVAQASKVAEALAREQDFKGLAAECRGNPVLNLYMPEAVLSEIGAAVEPWEIDAPRVAALLDLMVSQLAKVDVFTRALRGASREQDGFEFLLRRAANGVCKPGRQYIAWLKPLLGVKQARELLDLDQLNADPVIDESTLKRWHSGSEFPSEAKLGKFVSSIFRSQAKSSAKRTLFLAEENYHAARRLDQVLGLFRSISSNAARLDRAERWRLLTGASDADTWVATRYCAWLRHWEASSSPGPGQAS